MDSIAVKTPAARVSEPHIYILKNVAEKIIKVGYSANMKERFRGHAGSNPSLKFITAIPVSGQAVELALHQALKPYRAPKATEWYTDSFELRDFLVAYFLKENIINEPNWAIVCELPPDQSFEEATGVSLRDITAPKRALKNAEIPYADLPPYYLNQLKLNAWLNDLTLKQTAKDMLMEAIEANDDRLDEAIGLMAQRMNVAKSDLINGVLDGTIKAK